MYQYLFTPTYTDCLTAFAQNPQVSVALMEALGRLAADPFDRTVLRTHRVKGAQGKTFSSRVGGGGHRLIWRLVNRSIVLLLFGEHDPVYQRAERLRLEIDTSEDVIRVFDRDPSDDAPTPYTRRRTLEGRLFMAWTDAELSASGFEADTIAVLRTLDTEQQLLELERRLGEETFERAYNLVAHGNAEGRVEDRSALLAAEERGQYDAGPDQAEQELERRLHAPAARAEFVPVGPDALAEVLGRPIEDWMVFLHPDQVRLAERSFSGPARVRGGAGTGKTVVALHRARHLAARDEGTVLFTTYVRNLPTVFASLFARLAPELADRVEFINLHRWAYQYVRAGDTEFDLDQPKVDAAFAGAWSAVAAPGSYLADHGYPRAYYREELDWVIKGRDLRDLDSYLALERTGRGTPLNARHRAAVWELFEDYEGNLRSQRVIDFNDLLVLALQQALQRSGEQRYRAVIVDEAQDLTEVGVRLLHALVGDRPDGLLLVGDDAQSVYPGGYSLKEIGIDVVGRAGLLRVNYRNTAAILDAATALAGGDGRSAPPGPAGAPVECLRTGRPIRLRVFPSIDDHDEDLALTLAEAAAQPAVDLGDLAVLLPTNKLAAEYRQRIADLGHRTLDLAKYDGTPTAAVKVGTYQRAKGLEFKQVFLPRLEPATLGERRRFNEDEQSHAERLALLRRQLFVATTRARDDVWLASAGEPSTLVSDLNGRSGDQ